MEAFGILKFWRNAAAGADGRKAAVGMDEGEGSDEEDSFFELVLRSPDRVAVRRCDEAARKDFQFIESPRDVFLSKNDFSNSKLLSPVALLRSTPKFKVFMFGLRKSSKCEKTASNGELKGSSLNQFSKSSNIEESNFYSLKCRVEELPVASVLARENSLRSLLLKETADYEISSLKSSRDAVSRYLKLIKPLYLKVSKRQNEKAKFTESLTPPPSLAPAPAPANLSPRKLSGGSRVGSFKIVAKHLGKSRSASANADVLPPPGRRRDDSLLEQHDGIQSAILHCKRSYNSSNKAKESEMAGALYEV
ncbi:UNVERIFIED_CONTAM: putative membrane-associated kinase regulator 2 [Sesamum radiatum]|uniref:Membrane-associated kinase regulator 2 n=1 Tax=Sesamum radiatum TaxID=300843 RepID=A0AAW2NBP1_SESRA